MTSVNKGLSSKRGLRRAINACAEAPHLGALAAVDNFPLKRALTQSVEQTPDRYSWESMDVFVTHQRRELMASAPRRRRIIEVQVTENVIKETSSGVLDAASKDASIPAPPEWQPSSVKDSLGNEVISEMPAVTRDRDWGAAVCADSLGKGDIVP